MASPYGTLPPFLTNDTSTPAHETPASLPANTTTRDLVDPKARAKAQPATGHPTQRDGTVLGRGFDQSYEITDFEERFKARYTWMEAQIAQLEGKYRWKYANICADKDASMAKLKSKVLPRDARTGLVMGRASTAMHETAEPATTEASKPDLADDTSTSDCDSMPDLVSSEEIAVREVEDFLEEGLRRMMNMPRPAAPATSQSVKLVTSEKVRFDVPNLIETAKPATTAASEPAAIEASRSDSPANATISLDWEFLSDIENASDSEYELEAENASDSEYELEAESDVELLQASVYDLRQLTPEQVMDM